MRSLHENLAVAERLKSVARTTRYGTTLDMTPGREKRAVELATLFLLEHSDTHRQVRPERHGVVSKMGTGDVFFVYGDSRHVRVQQEMNNAV